MKKTKGVLFVKHHVGWQNCENPPFGKSHTPTQSISPI